MNRVNLVCTLVLLGLLVSPSLTLPADPSKNESSELDAGVSDPVSNEIPSSKDVETFNPEKSPSESTDVQHHKTFFQSSVLIKQIGLDGKFICGSITCPNGTETCQYTSKSLEDGKNCEVNYKCTSSNGTVLHEETKIEPAGQITGFNASEFQSFFDEMRQMMGSIFSNPFRTIF